MTIKWTIYEDLTLYSDVNLNVDQYAAYVKRVATDMQHHMFSLHTIKCTESICENI
jgi:riboflavin synthase alpha subunit